MCKQQVIINANLSKEQQDKVRATLLAAGYSMDQIIYESDYNCDKHDHSHNNEEKTQKKTFAEIIKEYGLNDEQVAFIKQYSMERSRRAYEKVAAREIGNDELIKDWTYAGYYDAGYRGADYCSAGHALRYVHIARNINTGKEIKFGIVCVRDFFNLTDVQIKFIKNGFAEANVEIQQVLDTYIKFNGDFNKYEEEYHYHKKLMTILDNDPSIIYFDRDKLEHLFKLAMIKKFFELQLPIPTYYESIIDRAYRKLEYFLKKKKETEQKLQQQNQQNDNEVYKELLNYLQQNHTEAYTIISNLLSIKSAKGLTDKQEYLLNKLLITKWQEFDKINQAYQKKQIKIKSFFIDAFDNIINSYVKFGGTDKQLALLKKAIMK